MKLFLLSVLLSLSLLVGCATRGTYTTLAASEKAAVTSYDAYMDGVIAGRTPTNNVPAVSQAFNLFQLSVRTAVDAAQGNTNAPVTPQVTSAKANLDQVISTSKGAP
jgi:hypothetical protein